MAKNPNPSLLDPGQIIKRVYDEANDQIRATLDASVNIAGQQVLEIKETEDSIVAFGTTDGTFTGSHKAIKVASDGTVQTSVTSSTLPSGAATSTKQDTGNTSLASIDSKITTVNTGAVTISSALPIGTNNIGSITDITGTISLPTGSATATKQDTGNTSLASIDGKLLNQTSSIATISRVSSSATSVSLIVSNASRKGLIFFNESTKTCYVKFGATASSTSYTFQMASNSTLILEENPIYTGQIDGIWSAANGAMQITELT